MTGDLRCSVVIPTYNRRVLLGHTLESLVRQTLPADRFEVLVVDDGSSDGTAEVVHGYRDRLNVRYFFQEDEGWRVARARNVGIAHARSEVTVMVDSGVVLHQGCLAAHLSSHETGDGPVAVCGYVYGFNLDNEDADEMARAIDVGDPAGTMARFAAGRRWLDIREYFYDKYTEDFNGLPAPWVVYWTCNVSARTSQLRAVGGFDEEFRTWGAEDLDLAYRLHRDGARFVLNRDASGIHYPHHKSFVSNEDDAQANYRYMAAKYATPIARLLPEMGEELNPFNFNDVIVGRGLPRCADFLAVQKVS